MKKVIQPSEKNHQFLMSKHVHSQQALSMNYCGGKVSLMGIRCLDIKECSERTSPCILLGEGVIKPFAGVSQSFLVVCHTLL